MTDLSEMRRVAEAAQTPWYNDDQDALVEFDHTFDPPTVLALLDVVEAAKGCLQYSEDEDGKKWVATYPAGVPALEAALSRLESHAD